MKLSSSAIQHIRECMEESGIEPSCPSCYRLDPDGTESWYDEASLSPFAWKAFRMGIGTYSGLSRESAIAALPAVPFRHH